MRMNGPGRQGGRNGIGQIFSLNFGTSHLTNLSLHTLEISPIRFILTVAQLLTTEYATKLIIHTSPSIPIYHFV